MWQKSTDETVYNSGARICRRIWRHKKYYIKPIGNFCRFYYYIRLCRNYYKEEVLPYDGEWVICDVEIGEDRMLPHSIRRVRIDVHDLGLTIQCISDVSYQGVGDDEVKHICYSILDYFQKNGEGKQVIFDYASHVLSTNGDITNRYVIVFLNSNRVFEFLTQPNKYGIHASNNVDNEEVLLNLARIKIQTRNEFDFNNLLPNLGRTSCIMLWNTLYVWLKDDFDKARRFIDRLPKQYINDVVDGNSAIEVPQIRTYLFEKGADLDIILDESVIDLWNAIALPDDQRKTNLRGEEIIVHKLFDIRYYYRRLDIISYILATGKANDNLKIALFICSGDNRILDMLNTEFVISEVAQMSDDTVRYFVSSVDIQHDHLMNDLYAILGIDRVIHVAQLENNNREKIIKYLPSKHVIYLDAYVGVTHEYITKESTDWYGGYWTWGEGMVNRQYDIITLKKIEYSTILFSSKESMLDLYHISEESTKQIRRAINEYVSDKYKEKVLKPLVDEGTSLQYWLNTRTGEGYSRAIKEDKVIKILNNSGTSFCGWLKFKLCDNLNQSSNQINVMSFENEIASIILSTETICER